MSCEAPIPGVDEVLCKVYIRVTPDRSEDEIRFVLLQLSPPPGSRRNDPYDRLRMKIRDLSPELIEDTFNIVWPDGEGEHVTLRSSEELSIAVSGTSAPEQSGKRVLKLLVLAGGKSGRNNLYDPEEGERHPGVVCDYCCEPIFGYRYRCLNCSDYDLCRRCEATGKIHSGHQMLRTPFPVKSLTGPDTRFQIIECLPVHRPSSMDTPTEERLSAERGDGRRSGARGRISMEAIRMSQEQVARALRSFWGALGVVGAEDCAVPPEEGEEAHAAEQHGEAVEAHELSEGASGGMLSPGAAKPIGNMASDSWVERSHRTMQQISEALLDHYHKLGVPSVPEEGVRDEKPVEAEEAVTAENAVGQGDNQCAEQSREAVPSPEPSSLADEPSSASSAVNAESTPEGSDVEQHEPDAELIGWTDLGRDSSNPLEAAMAALKSGKAGAAMEKTAALKDPVVEGMDVKVLAGLEFMKEMGFTDEGGWLTAILQHHSGDVTKVIQLLEEMGLMKFED